MARELHIRKHRHGMTLVELLVVIGIMTLLMAVSIPMIRPAFQDRYVREAGRQVNAFFSSAQSRAAELGRPVAVWIERVDASELGSRHATRLYLADVAPSFTGATLSSRAIVAPIGVTKGTLNFVMNDPVDPTITDPDNLTPNILTTLLAQGERFTIRFDHKGFVYNGQRTGPTTWVVDIPLGVPAGAEAGGRGLTFELTRGPSRSAAAPLTLPGDSVIDLSVSGMGTTGNEFDSVTVAPWTESPVIVSFAPSGRVEYVYMAGTAMRPFAPIHFLIGRKSRVVNPFTTSVANPVTANLADPACLWITISERTGTVLSSDNSDTSQLPPATLVPARIGAARELARMSRQKGGR
jgi:prepilin-type N-terminal cleavage/methylation domain-containing protein